MFYKGTNQVQIGLVLSPHGKRGKLKAYHSLEFSLFRDALMSGVATLSGVGLLACSNVVSTGKNGIAIISLVDGGPTLWCVDGHKFRNAPILCNREHLGAKILPSDLVGLLVYRRSGFMGMRKILYGQVIDVHNFGAGDLVELMRCSVVPSGVVEQDKKISSKKSISDDATTEMYPFLKNVFPKIDLTRGEMIISKRHADRKAHIAL